MATASKQAESVKVVVRCRPLLPNEIAKGYKMVVDMDVSRGVVSIHNPKAKSDDPKREFTYDAVYAPNSKQVDLYDETFRSIVDAVLEGYNGTIFAYGQTGTGKTYTMEGVRSNPEERGVIPNSFEHIFTHIDRTENEKYLVRVSYLEIYQEEVRDLLSKDHKKRLDVREKPDTGVYVKGLSSILTRNVKEIEGVMNLGNKNRSVGRTDMNEHSSRSHAIFIVTVECCAAGPDGNEHIRVGKLNLVDLAGSERQSKTGSTGERFKEATKINLSLSALGNVISALVDGKSSHVPYRDSKLTRLLQDSLGGNAKTVMVANVGPANYNYDETMMTLRYANRAKNIKNKPHINEDPKDALLREYQEEIMRLKMALEKRKKGGGVKKRRRVNAQGEVVSGEESEGEEGEAEGGDRAEVTLKMKQALLEEEKQAVLQNKELLEEEKQRLIGEVQRKADQLKKEQEKRDKLADMIKKMEGKLLAGGKNVTDRADDAKRAREKMRQEVIEHKRREREIRQQLEAKEESTLEIKGTFTSLQEEVDTKTKKLNKLKSKLKAARAEVADYKEEQASVREELALTIEELQRELKLRTQIVDNFIPLEEVEKVTRRAFYDEDMDEWQIKPLKPPDSTTVVIPRPVSAIGNLRPISIFARIAASNGDPRYMAQNILKVELDMPNRTTREFEGLQAPTLQDALDAAMQDEEEMDVDAFAFTSEDQRRVKGPRTRGCGKDPRENHTHRSLGTVPEEGGPNGARAQRSTSGSRSGQQPQQFPTSRGLVSRPVRFA